jgi:hypothetical protein
MLFVNHFYDKYWKTLYLPAIPKVNFEEVMSKHFKLSQAKSMEQCALDTDAGEQLS